MLYEQIRHADTIRRIYKMRHLLTQKKPPEMGTKMGYAKYSKYFYQIKSKLRDEGTIGSRGTFVESPPNLHVSTMPLRVNRTQIKVLGNRIPYALFLVLATGPPRRAADLAKDMHFSRKAVYLALKRMEHVGLVNVTDFTATAEDGSARAWLEEYMESVKAWIDASGDVAALFRMIPSYVGGPHARRLQHYESGSPVGPAEMHIFTHAPLVGLMGCHRAKEQVF